MHLATIMHSRLCHLLYNHVICIVRVSKGGRDLSRGGCPPLPPPPLNEALITICLFLFCSNVLKIVVHKTTVMVNVG